MSRINPKAVQIAAHIVQRMGEPPCEDAAEKLCLGMAQVIALYLPPVCDGCGNEIDPEVCHCGDLIAGHAAYYDHSPVPMGCDCGRVKLPEDLNIKL